MFALLSRRLRTVVIGAVLVRLAPVLGRVLHSTADKMRRRGSTGAVPTVLTKAGDGMSWVARRGGRGRRAVD
ncbi:MAG: hypothetical protein H0U09_03650 [Geodermatophilaceae bacterium]|jgi:hypothetical protein|nr:hypothetical protein [Geodermatophilaceae bacterium]